jgi:hypothetical protein
MPPRQKRRFWRICRVCFRRFRIFVWLLLLVALAALLYLNQIGLPALVKRPLLEKLRARGLDLQFSRLRLRWDRGFVAENVQFGRADEPLSPRLTLAEAEVMLNYKALTRLQLQVDSLALRRGRLVWPIAETNRAPRELALTDIQTDLRLLPNDQWALDNFKAGFAGGRIRLSAMVTNASAFRDWKFLQPKRPSPPGALQNRLHRLADALERTHFDAPPDLLLDLRGDARDLQSFSLRMRLLAPDAQTPWGRVDRAMFLVRMFPATNDAPVHAELTLQAAGAQTPWGATTNLQFQMALATSGTGFTNLVDGQLQLRADQVGTRWADAANVEFTAQWLHAYTNPVPLTGQGHFRCAYTRTPWGSANNVQLLTCLATPPRRSPHPPDDSWAWWARIEPYLLDWECSFQKVQAQKLEVETVSCAGTWRAPLLNVTNLHADLYQGQLDAHGGLNVATRELDAGLGSNVDPHKLTVLTEGARRWLAQFAWQKAPAIEANVALRLPAWTNREPNWRAEVQPTLRIQGQFQLTNGASFRDVPLTAVSSHLTYSNMIWRLPDLVVLRPEGRIDATHQANDRTRDYYWRLHSSIDPFCLRPLFQTNLHRHFDLLSLSQPPIIDGEIWGRWHDLERTGFKARLALTNFSFRGESANGVQATAQYTNRWMLVTDARLQRGAERLSAQSMGFDFNGQKIYLTNGFSTADPQAVARAIGAKTGRTVEPYRFTQPPTARVQGIIPMHQDTDADLHFDIEGGSFHWWKFHVPRISGHVHWRGERLYLTEVQSAFYGGSARGSASFDFQPREGTDFQFNVSATNALLQLLVGDISSRPNNLEGRLSGNLIVNQANSANWQTWQGGGRVDLEDGLIWDIPIFGVFSPILNGIIPGLGNSRATAGTGTFGISNGVVRSENLDFRCPLMRMDYHGAVDLSGQVDARVEAQLLRDAWVVGPLISTVFWPVTKLFEYKVTGTIAQPKTEPLYFIPKIVLLPFHPIRTLKELLPAENAPPAKPPAAGTPPAALPSGSAPAATPQNPR